MFRFLLCASIGSLCFLGTHALASDTKIPGEPVAFILLQNQFDEFKDVKHADVPMQRYVCAYKGLAFMDRKSEYPVLVTQAWNDKMNKYIKLYINWEHVIGLQIVNSEVTLE